jgi:tRNA dimethylallyltransferase
VSSAGAATLPLVITGPTAAGKSAVAMEICARWGATLVAMDAMTVYRGMDIGTAKPSAEDQARVRHEGLDVRAPSETFSAADFAVLAEAVIERGAPVVLCGGAPFYLRAFLDGLVPTAPVDLALRAELQTLPDPHAALAAVDPVLAARLHPNDHVRIVRGLEVHRLMGVTLSSLHATDQGERRAAEVVWVDHPELNARIDARVGGMMEAGYLEEVRGLLAAGVPREAKSMQSLGYRFLAAHLAGELPLEEAVALTARASRQFARKQRTFLRGLGFAPGGDPWAAAYRAFGPPPDRSPG